MAVLASDNFDRADGTLASANWANRQSTGFSIVSNKIQPSAYSGDRSNYYSSVTWPNDQYSQAVVSGITGTGGEGIGVAVRISSSAVTMYSAVVNAAGSNNVHIVEWAAGAFVGYVATLTQAFSDGDTLRLEAQGTTLRVFRNGTQFGGDFSDVSIASGFAGVAYISTLTAGALNDWEGGDLTAAVETQSFYATRRRAWR